MPSPAAVAAAFVALLSFLALAWIGSRISSHRRQRERAALDRAVVEERQPWLSLVDDPTDDILAVDPPATRRFTDADLDAFLAQRDAEGRTGRGL